MQEAWFMSDFMFVFNERNISMWFQTALDLITTSLSCRYLRWVWLGIGQSDRKSVCTGERAFYAYKTLHFRIHVCLHFFWHLFEGLCVYLFLFQLPVKVCLIELCDGCTVSVRAETGEDDWFRALNNKLSSTPAESTGHISASNVTQLTLALL